jgi:HD-like signal output (HDOD) protein
MSLAAALNREKLLITARTLPAAPQVLSELGELLQDVNTSLDEISSLLKRDAALAARIIRISNSSAMGSGVRIGAIEEAVNRVGFGEVYRLVGLATTSRLADRDLNYYKIGAETLRHHMMHTAIAAEALADRIGLDARMAYTSGLMRTLGMMVIDRIARERLSVDDAYDHTKHAGYAKWEGAVFGISNGDVSGIILTEWKFPADIVASVREHYLLRDKDYENINAVLLNLSGWLTQQSCLALTGEPEYWELNEKKLQAIGLSEEELRELHVDVKAKYEKIKSAI